MDVIEFMDKTDYRNMKTTVELMFQQCLQERNKELEKRRQRLRIILESDNMVYDEELAILMRERVEENQRRRLEWLGLKRVERERAEEELLAFKKLQREMENCEEVRHLHSKQNVIETKQAQLYQIEEKKVLRQREKRLEQMWLDVMQKYNEEKEKQALFEESLRKRIAARDQANNLTHDKESKLRNEQELSLWRQHHAEEDARAILLQKERQEAEVKKLDFKKRQQEGYLQNQITENARSRSLSRQRRLEEELMEHHIQKEQVQNERNKQLNEKLRNREWHKGYLNYAITEKRAIREPQDLLAEGVCVLPQKPKTPYGKASR